MLRLIGLILGLGVAYGLYFVHSALPIGTGFAARYLCTAVFEQGEDAKTIFEREVAPEHPLFSMTTYEIDATNREVSAQSVMGLGAMRAAHRPGFGCTLLVDQSPEGLRAQSKDVKHPPSAEANPVSGLRKGVTPRWNQFLETYLREPGLGSLRNSKAILVSHRGQLLAEGYGEGITAGTPLLGWSMTKTVLGILVGALVEQGKASLDESSLFPLWKDARAGVTLRQLLEMRSGLAFSEVYGPLEDATDMLYGSYSFSDFAMDKELEHAPGTHWSYSSGTSNLLARIVHDRVGASMASTHDWMFETLFQPLGMTSAFIETDPSGVFVGSSYMYASAKDWLTLGQFFSGDGMVGERRIVPEGWLQTSIKPVEGAPLGEYGFQVWLNAGASGNATKRLYPKLDREFVFFRGHNDQLVAMLPREELVVVRLGATLDDSWDTEQFLLDVLSLLEKGPQSEGNESQKK